MVFFFQAPLSQHIQTHLHHTVEVVRHAWNNQTLHISPWRFQNHQVLFLKACLQHRRAQQCADTIISYSKPWTTAIFSHPDGGVGGSKAKAGFIIYLHQREVCLISRWWGLFLWGARWVSWWQPCWTLFNSEPVADDPWGGWLTISRAEWQTVS